MCEQSKWRFTTFALNKIQSCVRYQWDASTFTSRVKKQRTSVNGTECTWCLYLRVYRFDPRGIARKEVWKFVRCSVGMKSEARETREQDSVRCIEKKKTPAHYTRRTNTDEYEARRSATNSPATKAARPISQCVTNTIRTPYVFGHFSFYFFSIHPQALLAKFFYLSFVLSPASFFTGSFL